MPAMAGVRVRASPPLSHLLEHRMTKRNVRTAHALSTFAASFGLSLVAVAFSAGAQPVGPGPSLPGQPAPGQPGGGPATPTPGLPGQPGQSGLGQGGQPGQPGAGQPQEARPD